MKNSRLFEFNWITIDTLLQGFSHLEHYRQQLLVYFLCFPKENNDFEKLQFLWSNSCFHTTLQTRFLHVALTLLFLKYHE